MSARRGERGYWQPDSREWKALAFHIPASRGYFDWPGRCAPFGDARAPAEEVQMLLANRKEARAGSVQLSEGVLQCYSWKMMREQLGAACSRSLLNGEVV